MEQFKPFAINLAKQAGELIAESFTLGMQKEWKSDNTPVTTTDKAINDMVVEAIKSTFPDHSIIAEEGSAEKVSEYAWVCDPIDGTIPFSHGIPTSTFSLALTQNGESILGVVYDPYMDRLFTAEKGKGAFLHDRKIHVSDTADIADAIIHSSGTHPDKYDITKLYSPPAKKRVHFFDIKASIYAHMLVACGEITAGIYGSTSPWDAAAVKIIVEEAGGKVTDLYGNEQRYDQKINGFIASNGLIHDLLVKHVQSCMKIIL